MIYKNNFFITTNSESKQVTNTKKIPQKMLSLFLACILVSYVTGDTEVAPYEVVKAHEGWEERSVPALKWISGDGFDISPHDGDTGGEHIIGASIIL